MNAMMNSMLIFQQISKTKEKSEERLRILPYRQEPTREETISNQSEVEEQLIKLNQMRNST